jgi:hypothetical protein
MGCGTACLMSYRIGSQTVLQRSTSHYEPHCWHDHLFDRGPERKRPNILTPDSTGGGL